MKKNIEEKILRELIDKVIQRDRDIQNRHEEEAVKNATKEALMEMTELSFDEINLIEKEIRQQMMKKPMRRIYLWLLLIILVIVSIVLFFKIINKERYQDKLIFTENFDDNSNGWELIDNIIYNKYYEGDKFFFLTNNDSEEKCFKEKMSLNFPANFTVEVTTTWHGGNKAPYGIVLSTFSHTSSDSYYLHPDHKAYTDWEYKKSDPWIKFPVTTYNDEYTNTQKLIAKRGYDFDYMPTGLIKYFVNEHHIGDAKTNYPFDAELSIKVCGSQKISFDHIKIINDMTGRVVLNTSFGKLKERFEERLEFKAMSSIEAGNYVFNTDVKTDCYTATIYKKVKNQSKIKVRSKWLDGEDFYYGFMLLKDQNEYYSFELRRDGIVYLMYYKNGKKIIEHNNIQTNFLSDGTNSINQTVFLKGEKLEYYINDKLILNEDLLINEFNKIGFKVCGHQSIAFDKLEIWE